MTNSNNPTEFLSIIAIVIVPAIFYWFLVLSPNAKKNRKTRGISVADSSILLAYYTENKKLIQLKSGNLDQFSFSAIATNDASTLIYRVQLPFATHVHLLGIPQEGNAAKLAPDSEPSIMEEVQLEGDYHKFFKLYTEKGQQVQARYVLDPKAMEYTTKFCTLYSWEILKGELYFVQTANAPNFNQIVGSFIREIRPSLEVALTKQELATTTGYGVDLRNNLKCPLCAEEMKNRGDYFVCPKGDGILLSGKNLKDLKNDTLVIEELVSTTHDKRLAALVCPACGEKMELLAYNGSKQIIDTCTHCPYRWLDTSEIAQIKALV